MRAGELRHRITILQMVESKNEVKESILIPQPWKTVWASVEPLEIYGRENIEAQKIQPEVRYKITIRYLSGITPEMKIDFKGRIFEIQNILNIGERNRYMEIYAVEKVEKSVG